MKILIINAGSSSLKYQLMDAERHDVLAKGLCERIGIDGHIKHTPSNGKSVYEADLAMPTHAEAIKAVLDILVDPGHGVLASVDEIGAVGHRVLHGGDEITQSVLITDEVLKVIEKCIPLGPLHNPANLTGIRACEAVMPKTPQVAVFDTSFHQTMPAKAYMYPIPYEYYETDKVRRYGFHGTSHRYVSRRAAELLGRSDLRLISCHLGNGSSIAAVKDGKCVDTTMGLTPLAGLPMGTRCGDIDPAVLQFLMNKYGYSADEMLNILNKKSGVLGVSGVSSDFRDLDNAAAQGNERARLALDMFCYAAAKFVAGYAAAMGGVDVVLFTAGVGENSADTRAGICDYLGFMGVKIDPEKNKVRGKEADISAEGATVKTLVVPTNEELMIAMDTAEIVSKL